MEEDMMWSANDEDPARVTKDPEMFLEPDPGKPSSSAELMKMINEAGTELTVKYITGELSFQEFCDEVVKRAKSQKRPKAKTKAVETSPPMPSTSSSMSSSVPGFDQMLMDEDESDEESDEALEEQDERKRERRSRKRKAVHAVEMEEELNEDEDSQLEDEGGDDNEDQELEFEDAGARPDDSGDEWLPDEEDRKKLKQKGPRKSKKEAKTEKPTDIGRGRGRRKHRKQRRKPWETPKYLMGAQGKAMLLKAQGHTREAMMMLYEIIKKAPKAYIPYEALGAMKEDMGDTREGIKFQMVGANLRRAEPATWFELEEICMKIDEPKLALTCLYRATKYAKNSKERLEVIQAKMAFFKSQGQNNKILPLKESALVYMPRDEPSMILTEARSIVKEYISMSDISGAISTLTFLSKELSSQIDAEDVHLLVELLMSQSNFSSSLEVLIQHCGVRLTLSGQVCDSSNTAALLADLVDKKVTVDSVSVPALMPLDLRSKMVQCLILMSSLATLEPIQKEIDALAQENIEEFGDIHFGIAEAMFKVGYAKDARPILHALVNSEKYSEAEVWLTYGMCLKALGETEAAAEAYSRVMEFVPSHYEARRTLAFLQQQMGLHQAALDTLSAGDGEDSCQDQLLLVYKCELLHMQGKMEEFASTAQRLLSLAMKGMDNMIFRSCMMSCRTIRHRKKYIEQFKPPSMKSVVDEMSDSGDLGKEEQERFCNSLWDVFLKLCYYLHSVGRRHDMLDVALKGVTCPAFIGKDERIREAEFMCIKSGVFNRTTCNLAKMLISMEPDHNQSWNIYSYVLARSFTDQRFIFRYLMREPHRQVLGFLNGNSRLICGTYKQALAEYLSVFRQAPDNAMAVLCCALSLLAITIQRHTSRTNVLIPQVMSFFSIYKELRGECQETYYNIARALGQLNFQYAAVKYYKKALACPPMVADEHGTFDLTREIAYNLACIYQKTGNLYLARHYIRTYCVV